MMALTEQGILMPAPMLATQGKGKVGAIDGSRPWVGPTGSSRGT